jgi:hypothetical protein
MLAIASLAGWPFVLIAWSLAGWFGVAVVTTFAVLMAMAMNHELVTFRQKVQQARSELVHHNIQGKEDKV